MTLEAGKQLGHYKILSQIGAGGMGEIYLAEDTKLDRQVALKILPPEFAEDKDRMNRFVREAKSASALNHPNIITIHEIGESEGTHFIATEFIDGKTLTEYVKSNPPSFKSTLEIAIQIASALDEAHSAGIIHRDIKPDNVMIRANGLAKILDFGIAKLTGSIIQPNTDAEAATAIKQSTSPGMIIGTANYMSPEQAAGKTVDARSDIFSFGVVLYEMVTGRLPFAGETAMEMIGAILKDEPHPLGAGVPVELGKIVGKCLKKNLSERYQSIKEACEDLKEFKQELEFREKLERSTAQHAEEQQTQILNAQTTAEENPKSEITNPKSIAVLPFANMSADEDNEYFCDGLAEELLNALSKIEDLKVAARTSAFSFKGKNAEAREIGEKLSVKNVLEGSVRRSGNKLRISVQLINASDGFHLWSERYDREMQDIFDVQDEITLSVVDALKLKLFGDEKDALLKRYTNNAEAYQLYLNGRYHYSKRGKIDLQRGIEYFQEAIKLDLNFALAYVGIADSYNAMPGFAYLSPHEATSHARAAAQKAIEIDPLLAEAHAALADCFATYDFNWSGAEHEYLRAIELNPNSAISHFHFATYYLTPMGRMNEATAEMSRALELEPFNLIINASLVGTYLFARQNEKALEQARKLFDLEPDFVAGQFWLGMAYSINGKRDEAIAHTEKILQANPQNQLLLMLAAVVYAESGRKDKAEQIIERFRELAKTQYVVSYYLATIYSALGKKDEAIGELEKSFEQRDFYFSSLNNNFVMVSLRDDMRFQDLIQRAGLPINKNNQTDESLEAKTVMLSSSDAGNDLAMQKADFRSDSEQTTDTKSEIQKPKSKWWLFGLLGLLLLVGGFFGYKYFTPTKQIESIAVMPFVNESGNADAEYLSDGMTETLIKSLSNLPNLNVKPRSSVFRYKGKDTDLQTIARELNVQAILNGRVVQRGDQLTLSLELVDVQKDSVIWTESYNRTQSDLVTLQSEIARDVSTNLKSKLSGAEETKVTKAATSDPEAYQAYLKGRYYWNRRTSENLKKAIEQFKAATDRDPNYALAFAGLADCYVVLNEYAGTPTSETLPQAKAYVERALSLDGQLAEAHATLGNIKRQLWQWAEAEKEFKRAIELNPTYPTAYHWYSLTLLCLGRKDESLAMIQRARELDPMSSIITATMSWVQLSRNNHQASIENLLKLIELDPNFGLAYGNLGLSYLKIGRNAEAVASLEKAAQLTDRYGFILGDLGYVYAATGKLDQALAVIKELEEKYSRKEAKGLSVAAVYAGLGDKDKAFDWLEKDYQNRDGVLPDITVSIPLESLRDDPRFKDLLRRLNLPPQ